MHQLHFGNNPTDFSGFLEKKKKNIMRKSVIIFLAINITWHVALSEYQWDVPRATLQGIV